MLRSLLYTSSGSLLGLKSLAVQAENTLKEVKEVLVEEKLQMNKYRENLVKIKKKIICKYIIYIFFQQLFCGNPS